MNSLYVRTFSVGLEASVVSNGETCICNGLNPYMQATLYREDATKWEE